MPTHTDERVPLALQLRGYRLATVHIFYHLPDHPGLIGEFVWQLYDIDPDYPELHKFLDFWSRNIDGTLHSVEVGRRQIIAPPRHIHAQGMWELH